MTAPVSFFKTYDDLTIRYGIRTCRDDKKAGSIILLSGRQEFIEKYTETITELNRRNFDVYTMEWRGQGLSARQLPNRHKGYVRTYDDYLDDLNRFVNRVVSPRAVLPCMILAHSMGGHIALRYLHDHPGHVEKAVLTAPMIDIVSSAFKRLLIRVVARFAVSAGMDHMYVVASGDYRAADQKFNGNRLTSDPRRFMDVPKAIAANPDLALGGVTYRWLKATLDSIDILKGSGYPEAIRTPVLIVGAGCDRVVSLKAQEQICERLPGGRIRIIPQARHEVLKETDQVRSVFWQAFDRFIFKPDSGNMS